ncbi:MAG: 30S ribosomal protein S15 [Pirellulales bacterium]|nr:30S ribosomal protein S15 [Pirellulales bacterium]
MAVTKETRQKLIADFKRGETDSGSPEVQIALLTARINDLTDHFRTHDKDYASRRGLMKMVSNRRRLLDYLKSIDPQRYLDVIKRLDIRK